MPRSRSGKLPPPPPEPPAETDDPDLDCWGSDPDLVELGPAPPPPPALGASPAERAAPPPAAVTALGTPPDDTISAAKWAYQMHMRLAHDASMDPSLTPSQRRKEVRVTLAGAAKHMNDAMRYDVLQIINKEREDMEAKKRGRARGQLEPLPPPGDAKVIPIHR